MSESKSSSVAVRVLAGVLTAAALWALSKIPGLLVWFGNIFGLFWIHLKSTSGVPNWCLYLLVFVALHTLVNFVKRLLKPKGPDISAYNQDSFMDIVWRWSYIHWRTSPKSLGLLSTLRYHACLFRATRLSFPSCRTNNSYMRTL